jgi:carbamoyltransferase
MDPNEAFDANTKSLSEPNIQLDKNEKVEFSQQSFSAYQGKFYSEEDIDIALYDLDPWIQFERFDSEEDLVKDAAEQLTKGEVLGWFQGRSEFGQRALGSR